MLSYSPQLERLLEQIVNNQRNGSLDLNKLERTEVLGLMWNQRALTTNTTLNTDDGTAFCNTAGGAFTVTLPVISTVPAGRVFVVADSGGVAGTNNLTISGNGSNINGSASLVLYNNYAAVMVQSTGTQWIIIACCNQQRSTFGDVVSAFLLIPQLRGLWPFSSVNETNDVLDLSAQGRTVSDVAAPAFGVQDLVPYATLNGTTQYFTRADEAGLDITGGITFGGWFRVGVVATNKSVMGKWSTTGNQRSYFLQQLNTNSVQAGISSTGVNVFVSVSSNTVALNQWHFIVGRFIPSTSVSIFMNGTFTTNSTGIPAAIFNSTAAFDIGDLVAPTSPFNGRVTLCFLSATNLSDDYIRSLYNISRGLLGV